VLVVAEDAGVEAALEEMADAPVSLVELLGVQAVQALAAGGQALERRLDDRVVVVVHQAVGVADPVEPARDEEQVADEERAILVVANDRAAVDAACGHVVDAAFGKRRPRQPSHDSTVAA